MINWCENFPTTSKFHNGDIDNEYTVIKSAQTYNSIRKSYHLSLINKKLLPEIHQFNTEIPEIQSLKIAKNVEEINSNYHREIREIPEFLKRSNDRMWKMRMEKNESEKEKLNWKWYKSRSAAFIPLLILVFIVYSPIQLVTAILRSGSNGYCEANSG